MTHYIACCLRRVSKQAHMSQMEVADVPIILMLIIPHEAYSRS